MEYCGNHRLRSSKGLSGGKIFLEHGPGLGHVDPGEWTGSKPGIGHGLGHVHFHGECRGIPTSYRSINELQSPSIIFLICQISHLRIISAKVIACPQEVSNSIKDRGSHLPDTQQEHP